MRTIIHKVQVPPRPRITLSHHHKGRHASGFVEYARSFGPVYMQVGVRFEHVAANYYEEGKQVKEQSKHYNNWFPSATIVVPVRQIQLALSYSSDIVRPSYRMLRGNIVYNNRYTYYTRKTPL